MKLTEAELAAKTHFIRLVTEGKDVPIDEPGTLNLNFEKPSWFDEDKYERGRQYFFQNRMGILSTNLLGLIVLLAVPKGLAILNATQKSNNPDTARQRYAETTLHTLSWFEFELKNDTKSWQSLRKVRRLHLNASNMALKKNIGFISQSEVATTTFGFAGFVINRPHLFGIKHDNDEDREGFIHLWAVLNYMLGVEDRFNICLLPLEAVQIEFELIMRHVLNPLIQFETTLFKEMVTAMVDGMNAFMRSLDYDTLMFLTKRAIGVPGYQYNVDLEKEKPYRNIFTEEDIKTLKDVTSMFSEKIQVFKLVKSGESVVDENNNDSKPIEIDPTDLHYTNLNFEVLEKLCNLPKGVTIVKEEFSKDETNYLNGDKYNDLKWRSKLHVNMNDRIFKSFDYRMGSFLFGKFLDFNLNKMRNSTKG